MKKWLEDASLTSGSCYFFTDHVSIVEPKEDVIPTTPYSEQKGGKLPEPAAAAPAVPVPVV